MANRHFNAPVQSLWHKPILVGGKIALSAAAAVTSSDIKGASVAKTGTGEYTITLEDKFSGMIGASLVAADNAAKDLVLELKSINLSAKTMIVVTKIAGVAANTDEALDIWVTLHLNNSSVD